MKTSIINQILQAAITTLVIFTFLSQSNAQELAYSTNNSIFSGNEFYADDFTEDDGNSYEETDEVAGTSTKFTTTTTTPAYKPVKRLFERKEAWGLSYAKDGVIVQQFEIAHNAFKKYNPSTSIVIKDVMLKGTIKDDISVFRMIQSNGKRVNLSKYNTLAFDVKGTGALEIVLSKKGILTDAYQPRTTIQIEKQCGRVYLTKKDFAQLDGNLDWNDLKSIEFVKKGNGTSMEAFELKISNIEFLDLDVIPNCMNYNGQKVNVTIAPSHYEINVPLLALGNQTFEIELTDRFGKVSKIDNGTTNTDGSINFSTAGLKAGLYTYTVKVASRIYNGKVMVK